MINPPIALYFMQGLNTRRYTGMPRFLGCTGCSESG